MTGPRPMANDAWSRWVASLVLSVSCGISAGLLSGEPATGFFLAAFLAVMLTVIVMLSPAAGRGRQPKELYYYAVVVLIGPWILVKLGYQGRRSSGAPGWEDLQSRYPAKGPAPGGLVSVGEVVVNRRISLIMVQPYRYRRATATLSDEGVHLALSFPWSWIYDPVALPARSIRECRRDSMKTDFATLALQDVTLEVDVADAAGQVLQWCEHHEIPDGSG